MSTAPGGLPGDGYDDAELDAVLETAMANILAKLEAAFDPQAGLEDIYARATASPRETGEHRS